MYSRVCSAGLRGMETFQVDVEADISNGLPCMEFVGALGQEVREGKERVKAALHHFGIALPPKRITINLSPADIRKEGCAYDLAVAAVLLQALELIKSPFGSDTLLLGELGLDGEVRPVNGILPLVLFARNAGFKRCILPALNAEEGSLAEDITILAVSSLDDLWKLQEDERGYVFSGRKRSVQKKEYKDFSDISGQESLKRAALVAASGMHNILLTGPPGSGKTMAAERIPGILPELSPEEKFELTQIYSICGKIDRSHPLIEERPFRKLHSHISRTTLLGGGRIPRPGEISLAHRGVLFLDEAAEYDRSVLESLRQPMEEGEIHLSRVYGVCAFPASFMLVAAMNPCPCGFFPDRSRCHCTQSQIEKYQKKISGALLDRIDLRIEAVEVTYEHLVSGEKGKGTSELRLQAEAAAARQKDRFRSESFCFNSQIPAALIPEYCRTDAAGQRLLEQAFSALHLSARSYHRVLKVSRTIADLDGADMITEVHISEALSYRMNEYVR